MTRPNHMDILRAAAVVYGNAEVSIDGLNEAQQMLKRARQYGYRFNAYGAVISFSPEQMGAFVAADQIWASMQAHGRPDVVMPT